MIVFRSPLCQNSGNQLVISFFKQLLPQPVRRWLSHQKLKGRRAMLPLDRISNFSQLRRITPYRPSFGWFRGQCIDRVYIEKFLSQHAHDIRGRCLEIGEKHYLDQFGGNRVSSSDVLDMVPREEVTILADLADGGGIASDSFDCVICTQVLMYIYNVREAIATISRVLAPGGVALITVAGISQLAPPSMMAEGGEFWRFTSSSAQRLFAEAFGEGNVEVKSFGNVLAATALLHGLVAAELTEQELSFNDPDYPVTVAVRAVKAAHRVQAND